MRKVRLLCIILLSLILIVSITSCSSKESTSNKEANENEISEIIFKGLEDSETIIGVQKIKSYESVERDVISIDSAGNKEQYTAKGTLLDDILKDYGKTQSTISAVRLIAGDGYSIEIPKEVLSNREVILAYEINGEPLDEGTKPIRAVVPDERAMYWVKNVIEVEIITNKQSSSIDEIIFLEAMLEDQNFVDYKYYNNVDKAVNAGDLISSISNKEDIHIKASDGLDKNEKLEVFDKGFIKVNGEDSPAFVSEDIPVGMHVKSILWMHSDTKVIFSYSSGQKIFEKETVNSKQGIKITDILNELNVNDISNCTITQTDGTEENISKDKLDKSIVSISDGELQLVQKDTSINKVYSIKIN